MFKLLYNSQRLWETLVSPEYSKKWIRSIFKLYFYYKAVIFLCIVVTPIINLLIIEKHMNQIYMKENILENLCETARKLTFCTKKMDFHRVWHNDLSFSLLRSVILTHGEFILSSVFFRFFWKINFNKMECLPFIPDLCLTLDGNQVVWSASWSPRRTHSLQHVLGLSNDTASNV